MYLGATRNFCGNFGKSEDQSFPIASRVSPELATKGAYSNFEQCPNGNASKDGGFGKGENAGEKHEEQTVLFAERSRKMRTTWVSSYQLLAKV